MKIIGKEEKNNPVKCDALTYGECFTEIGTKLIYMKTQSFSGGEILAVRIHDGELVGFHPSRLVNVIDVHCVVV